MRGPIYLLLFLSLLLATSAGCQGGLSWDNDSGPPASVLADDAVEGVISRPHPGDVVTSPVSTVEGRIADWDSSGELFLFLKDAKYGGFYLQYPPAQIDAAGTAFTQRNIRASSGVDWELYLVHASPSVASQLHLDARLKRFGARTHLPTGCRILDRVALKSR